MINKEIEDCAAKVYAKYVKRGGSYKKFSEIMAAEGIKFKEVNSANVNFIGAFTRANSGQLYIMANGNIDNIGRRNFTIAHELGHYFLNHLLHSNAFYCCNDEVAEESLASDSMEREANYFADCLLMPEDKIRGAFLARLKNSRKAKMKDFLCVKNNYTYSIWCGIRADLMSRYGVSEAALRYRLSGLRLARFEFS